MKIAIVPGSFDPLTQGHVDLVERAAALFDQVVVAVMVNDAKTYRFSSEQRRELAALSCAHIPNVRVIFDKGMLVDLVDKLGACAIVKGIRNEKDFAYEQKMAYYNKEKNPRAETIYLPCAPHHVNISSTVVRARLDAGVSIDDLIHPNAVAKLLEWDMARPAKNETSRF